MSVRPTAIVLPAFAADDYTGEADEVERWLDAYDFDRRIDIDGGTVRYDPEAAVALAPTGIGKAAAAARVAGLLAADGVDTSAATFVTVGVAGCRPGAGTIGTVVVADAVVDWDLKRRTGDATASLAWLDDDPVWRLDPALVERAAAAAREADVTDSASAQAIRERRGDDRSPEVTVGASVCADEVWHGRATAAAVREHCSACGVDGFAATQMEDAGTATALSRTGRLDRYVAVRAAANFDREPPGGDPDESARRHDFPLAAENAFRAGRRVVEALRDRPLGA